MIFFFFPQRTVWDFLPDFPFNQLREGGEGKVAIAKFDHFIKKEIKKLFHFFKKCKLLLNSSI